MNISDYLKSWPLYILPHHLISRGVFRLTRLHSPLVPAAIRGFSKVFGVNLAEAVEPDPAAYTTFNEFFTRPLKPELRPLTRESKALASPVDGAVSQCGAISAGRIVQAKGHDYSVLELLGGNQQHADYFTTGQFMTIYLSPRDYHRIHMPLDGRLLAQTYVPGRLFSVAGHTARTIPRLFARNERVVALFDTEFGKMAMVLVGAINVAAIETVWDGLITPPNGKTILQKKFDDVSLEKGEEMGRFNMGSTVILLLEKPAEFLTAKSQSEAVVRLGEKLALFH
ncbi:MAG: archaetidylserine decarboxylase [Thiolinea sp.]